MKNVERFHFYYLLNAVALAGVSSILVFAFGYQFINHDIPCPLCLLQRAGLILVGLGFQMNLSLKPRNSHYGFVLIGSLLTATVAVRQTLLHITPDDPGYSSTVLGIHFYTWCAISSAGMILLIAFFTFISDLSLDLDVPAILLKLSKEIGLAASGVFLVIIFLNLVSTLFECGLGSCPENPVSYIWLSHSPSLLLL